MKGKKEEGVVDDWFKVGLGRLYWRKRGVGLLWRREGCRDAILLSLHSGRVGAKAHWDLSSKTIKMC